MSDSYSPRLVISAARYILIYLESRSKERVSTGLCSMLALDIGEGYKMHIQGVLDDI